MNIRNVTSMQAMYETLQDSVEYAARASSNSSFVKALTDTVVDTTAAVRDMVVAAAAATTDANDDTIIDPKLTFRPHIPDTVTKPTTEDKHKDMNIVLFYADDWTWRSIGAVNKHVLTPNIDNMARKGIMFPYNCVTTSICWQSRATLFTGLYVAVHQHVRIGSETIFNKTVQWPQTLYPLLRAAGYHVGFVGKWHAPLVRTCMHA